MYLGLLLEILDMVDKMDFEKYQTDARKTAIYDGEAYPYVGLASEVGEVCAIYKRKLRDKNFDKEKLISELGDVLWYLAACASDAGISLDEVAVRNIEKLLNRQKRGMIQGKGDDR